MQAPVILESGEPIPRGLYGWAPADLLLQVVAYANTLAEGEPSILYDRGEASFQVLYRGTPWLWRDLAEACGDAAAVVSATWPLTFSGGTEDRETVQLTFRADEGGARTTAMHAFSGKAAEELEGLGIQVDARDSEAAFHLAELCGQVSRCRGIASRRIHESFLAGSQLLIDTPGSAYLYLSWEKQERWNLLRYLSLGQEEQLWHTFLAEQVQPLEFEWLWSAYQAGKPLLLLEWSVTLHRTLKALGFHVRQQAACFEVTDTKNNPRRFDLIQGGPAEKVLLKLLFPLDAR